MLSDSPPERDLEWTDAGVAGAWRYTQKLWRIFEEASLKVRDDRIVEADPNSIKLDAKAKEMRIASHKMLDGITQDIERFRFNRAVARIHEFTNLISAFKVSNDEDAVILREGLRILNQVIAPMMPHIAEELWRQMGHDTMLADTPWPKAEQTLLVDNFVTIGVQVGGKLRGTIEVAADADETSVREAAMAIPNVQNAIAGRDIQKVIVVQNRIVNVVL